MNIFIRIIGIAALMTGITTGAAAQEQPKDSAKVGFFRQAFRDMKESAKRQREIDKATFKAQTLESKAFKAMRNPQFRKGVQEKEYRQKMEEAKARQEAAQKRIDEAKGNK